MRVLIAEDDPDYRDALAELLEAECDLHVVGRVGSAEEAIELAAQVCPNVVLMDVRLPGADGIAATSQLMEAHPALIVVMLTLFADEASLFDALAVGAAGFVLKSTDPAAIASALRYAAAGDVPVDPAMTHHLVNRALNAPRPTPEISHSHISPREKEVLGLLSQGCTDAEIAHRLGVAVPTVRTYLNRLRGKLGVRSRLQLVLQAGAMSPRPHP